MDGDRLDDLENALINVDKRLKRLERGHIDSIRNARALMVGFVFFSLLILIGAKFDGDKWRWELSAEQVRSLVEVVAVSGVVGGGLAIATHKKSI